MPITRARVHEYPVETVAGDNEGGGFVAVEKVAGGQGGGFVAVATVASSAGGGLVAAAAA